MKKAILLLIVASFFTSCKKDKQELPITYNQLFTNTDIDVLFKWESYDRDIKIIEQGDVVTAYFIKYSTPDTIIYIAKKTSDGLAEIETKDGVSIAGGTISYVYDSCIVTYPSNNWTGYNLYRGRH